MLVRHGDELSVISLGEFNEVICCSPILRVKNNPFPKYLRLLPTKAAAHGEDGEPEFSMYPFEQVHPHNLLLQGAVPGDGSECWPWGQATSVNSLTASLWGLCLGTGHYLHTFFFKVGTIMPATSQRGSKIKGATVIQLDT